MYPSFFVLAFIVTQGFLRKPKNTLTDCIMSGFYQFQCVGKYRAANKPTRVDAKQVHAVTTHCSDHPTNPLGSQPELELGQKDPGFFFWF